MAKKNAPISTPARLIKVGEKLFAKKGFHGVTLREVAKEAKTNVASVHYHFGDKYKFYGAIFENFFSRIRDTISQAQMDGKDPKAQVLMLNAIMQKNMEEYQDFNRMFSRALLNEGEPRLNAILKKTLKQNLKPLVDLLCGTTAGLTWKVASEKMAPRTLVFLMIAMNVYWTLFSPAYVNLFDDLDRPKDLRQEVFQGLNTLIDEMMDNQ